MRRALVFTSLLAAVAAGCGGSGGEPPVAAVDLGPGGARAHAPAPAAAAALTRVPDGPAARERLGYVNADRLGAARAVRRAVLGGVAGRLRVGHAARRPEGDPGQTTAITPAAQSAAQSCLGDPLAETLLGPATMGRDAALGVALRTGADPPAGRKLVICFAPHYRRAIHTARRALGRRFGGLPGARIEEVEIGERETLSAVLPARALGRGTVLDLLSGGAALRASLR